MKMKAVLAVAITVSFAAPAMAGEYYVMREPHSKHCTVTTTKPTHETEVTRIGPIAFKTREEAEKRVKTTTVCSEEEDNGTSVKI